MIERRATRFYLGAVAEVIDLDSRRDLVGVSRDLSLSGTFVRTSEPFASGTEVRVRLTASGANFAATGRVTDNVTPEGMGIEFVEVLPKDHAILETWLSISKNAFSPAVCCDRLIRSVPVFVSGESSTGAFVEETETRFITSESALLHLRATVSPGQVVRLKNGLTVVEEKCRLVFVDAKPLEKRKLLEVEFLESARKFWGVKKGARSFPF
jgi:PilZ domain